MQYNKNDTMEKIDKILIVIALVLISTGSAYLFLAPDVYQGEIRDVGPIVATVLHREKTVKVKKNGSHAWTESFIDQNLYENDQVYTHENANALLEFENEIKVGLKESTLIRILPIEKNKDFLELKKGNFDLAVDGALTPIDLNVNIKGKSYRFKVLEESTLKIAEIGGEGKIDLLSGRMNLYKDGEKVRLTGGDQAVTSEGLEKTVLQVNIKEPDNNAKLIKNEISEIKFAWDLETNLNITNAKFRIAKDEFFQQVIHEHDLSANEYTYKPNKFIPGTYYWKIDFKTEKDIQSSDTRKFKIVAFTTPIAQQPNNEKVFFLPAGVRDMDVKMEWSESGYDGTTYTVEYIKDNRDKYFKEVLQPSYTISLAPAGRYHWRVKAMHPDLGSTEWSELQSFTIKEKEVIGRMKPPHKGKTSLNKPNDLISFSWKSVKGFNGKYTFQLSPTNNFSNFVQEIKTKSSRVKVKIERDGVYYWKVKADTTALSPVNTVYIQKSKIPPPISLPSKIKMKKTRSGGSDAYLISWKGDRNAKAYIIEIYRDKFRGKKMLSQKIFKSSYLWEGKRAGVYYFRVQTVDSWGRKTKFSKLAKLTPR